MVTQGETHALMGPNGSGKSTLSNVIMGRPGYVVTQGQGGASRARTSRSSRPTSAPSAACSWRCSTRPRSPACRVVNFLRTAYQAVKGEQVSALAFRKHMKEQMDVLGIEDSMVQRYVNQGFSGGEKKRNEVLQLAVLEPQIAILDETDSGLDIDSLKLVADGRERAGRSRARRAAHHPLPAHAQLHHARPGPRDDEGSYREVRRSRARARARGQGVRGHPATSSGLEADATAED